ncbi:MAG: hypothetical protein ISS36_00725 [Candidatus Aenigmarchaeota archaeon]|nr:hypothetical protein [Candidatus Aenigmarchaeota archaeon]
MYRIAMVFPLLCLTVYGEESITRFEKGLKRLQIENQELKGKLRVADERLKNLNQQLDITERGLSFSQEARVKAEKTLKTTQIALGKEIRGLNRAIVTLSQEVKEARMARDRVIQQAANQRKWIMALAGLYLIVLVIVLLGITIWQRKAFEKEIALSENRLRTIMNEPRIILGDLLGDVLPEESSQ